MLFRSISNNGVLQNPNQLAQWFAQLKSGGVDGVMTDVWWGIVERNGPKNYDWTAYIQMAQLVKNAGLKMQVVMSFHQCGSNVGDTCYITLPQFVLNVGKTNSDIFYKDYTYSPDQEYLTLGVDNQTLFEGRSAYQIYVDYMTSFASNFKSFFGNTINQVQIGLGPSGEMRYPSYQSNKWTFCGIGEFQNNDKYMLANLKQAAAAAGHSDWGNGGPDNAGSYNTQPPSAAGFFSQNGYNNYASNYGQFFLNWYSSQLLIHAESILCAASNIFTPFGITIAGKVAGIHWWYADPSHAAELTAGYYNTNNNNAYLQIAQVFAKCNALFDFTALEMTDQSSCGQRPQELVKQTILAAQSAGIGYAGENALNFCTNGCYQGGFDEIYTESTQYGNIHQFTFLRLFPALLQGNNWNMFTAFVARMHSA